MAEPAQTRSPTLAAVALIGSVAINNIGFGIIIPLLPFYAKSMHTPAWLIAIMFSAYSAGSFFGEPFWGRLSDRIGRKPILLSAVTCNGLCYFALAFTHDIWLALLIRFASGALGSNIAVCQAYLADVSPPGQRTRYLSYMGAAWSIGFIAGPSLGGLLADPAAGVAGFRLPLFVAAGLSAGSALSILLLIRESRPTGAPATHRPSPWAVFGEAVRNPVVGPLLALSFLVGFAFTGVEGNFALWAQAHLGWGPRQIGFTFIFTAAAAGLTQLFVTGPLSERYGAGRMLAVGMACAVAAATLMPFSGGFATTAALMSLLAVGQSVSGPNVPALISRNFDPLRLGQVLGLNGALFSVARVTGPFCAGLGFSAGYIHAPFVMAAVVVTPAIWLAVSAARRANRAADASSA